MVSLAEYLPDCLVRLLTETKWETLVLGPVCRDYDEACVLFLDIAGFTPLTEMLKNRGSGAGAEELSFLLNRYFELLVRAVAKTGGDVVKYAGDALMAVWLPTDSRHSAPYLLNSARILPHSSQHISGGSDAPYFPSLRVSSSSSSTDHDYSSSLTRSLHASTSREESIQMSDLRMGGSHSYGSSSQHPREEDQTHFPHLSSHHSVLSHRQTSQSSLPTLDSINESKSNLPSSSANLGLNGPNGPGSPPPTMADLRARYRYSGARGMQALSPGMVVALRRAVQCALSIQTELSCTHLISGISLNVRIGIGAGKGRLVTLGGLPQTNPGQSSSAANMALHPSSRFDYLFVGEAVTAALAAEKLCPPGKVAIPTRFWPYLSDHFEGIALNDRLHSNATTSASSTVFAPLNQNKSDTTSSLDSTIFRRLSLSRRKTPAPATELLHTAKHASSPVSTTVSVHMYASQPNTPLIGTPTSSDAPNLAAAFEVAIASTNSTTGRRSRAIERSSASGSMEKRSASVGVMPHSTSHQQQLQLQLQPAQTQTRSDNSRESQSVPPTVRASNHTQSVGADDENDNNKGDQWSPDAASNAIASVPSLGRRTLQMLRGSSFPFRRSTTPTHNRTAAANTSNPPQRNESDGDAATASANTMSVAERDRDSISFGLGVGVGVDAEDGDSNAADRGMIIVTRCIHPIAAQRIPRIQIPALQMLSNHLNNKHEFSHAQIQELNLLLQRDVAGTSVATTSENSPKDSWRSIDLSNHADNYIHAGNRSRPISLGAQERTHSSSLVDVLSKGYSRRSFSHSNSHNRLHHASSTRSLVYGQSDPLSNDPPSHLDTMCEISRYLRVLSRFLPTHAFPALRAPIPRNPQRPMVPPVPLQAALAPAPPEARPVTVLFMLVTIGAPPGTQGANYHGSALGSGSMGNAGANASTIHVSGAMRGRSFSQRLHSSTGSIPGPGTNAGASSAGHARYPSLSHLPGSTGAPLVSSNDTSYRSQRSRSLQARPRRSSALTGYSTALPIVDETLSMFDPEGDDFTVQQFPSKQGPMGTPSSSPGAPGVEGGLGLQPSVFQVPAAIVGSIGGSTAGGIPLDNFPLETVHHPEPEISTPSLLALDAFLALTQHCLGLYKGDLNKVALDEKGCLVLCVFGLYPDTAGIPEERAALCALTLAQELKRRQKHGPLQRPVYHTPEPGAAAAQAAAAAAHNSSTGSMTSSVSGNATGEGATKEGKSSYSLYGQAPYPLRSRRSSTQVAYITYPYVTVSCGISSGTAFCGTLGAYSRKEYTVLGDTVNTAARVMMEAEAMKKNHKLREPMRELAPWATSTYSTLSPPLSPLNFPVTSPNKQQHQEQEQQGPQVVHQQQVSGTERQTSTTAAPGTLQWCMEFMYPNHILMGETAFHTVQSTSLSLHPLPETIQLKGKSLAVRLAYPIKSEWIVQETLASKGLHVYLTPSPAIAAATSSTAIVPYQGHPSFSHPPLHPPYLPPQQLVSPSLPAPPSQASQPSLPPDTENLAGKASPAFPALPAGTLSPSLPPLLNANPHPTASPQSNANHSNNNPEGSPDVSSTNYNLIHNIPSTNATNVMPTATGLPLPMDTIPHALRYRHLPESTLPGRTRHPHDLNGEARARVLRFLRTHTRRLTPERGEGLEAVDTAQEGPCMDAVGTQYPVRHTPRPSISSPLMSEAYTQLEGGADRIDTPVLVTPVAMPLSVVEDKGDVKKFEEEKAKSVEHKDDTGMDGHADLSNRPMTEDLVITDEPRVGAVHLNEADVPKGLKTDVTAPSSSGGDGAAKNKHTGSPAGRPATLEALEEAPLPYSVIHPRSGAITIFAENGGGKSTFLDLLLYEFLRSLPSVPSNPLPGHSGLAASPSKLLDFDPDTALASTASFPPIISPTTYSVIGVDGTTHDFVRPDALLLLLHSHVAAPLVPLATALAPNALRATCTALLAKWSAYVANSTTATTSPHSKDTPTTIATMTTSPLHTTHSSITPKSPTPKSPALHTDLTLSPPGTVRRPSLLTPVMAAIHSMDDPLSNAYHKPHAATPPSGAPYLSLPFLGISHSGTAPQTGAPPLATPPLPPVLLFPLNHPTWASPETRALPEALARLALTHLLYALLHPLAHSEFHLTPTSLYSTPSLPYSFLLSGSGSGNGMGGMPSISSLSQHAGPQGPTHSPSPLSLPSTATSDTDLAVSRSTGGYPQVVDNRSGWNDATAAESNASGGGTGLGLLERDTKERRASVVLSALQEMQRNSPLKGEKGGAKDEEKIDAKDEKSKVAPSVSKEPAQSTPKRNLPPSDPIGSPELKRASSWGSTSETSSHRVIWEAFFEEAQRLAEVSVLFTAPVPEGDETIPEAFWSHFPAHVRCLHPECPFHLPPTYSNLHSQVNSQMHSHPMHTSPKVPPVVPIPMFQPITYKEAFAIWFLQCLGLLSTLWTWTISRSTYPPPQPRQTPGKQTSGSPNASNAPTKDTLVQCILLMDGCEQFSPIEKDYLDTVLTVISGDYEPPIQHPTTRNVTADETTLETTLSTSHDAVADTPGGMSLTGNSAPSGPRRPDARPFLAAVPSPKDSQGHKALDSLIQGSSDLVAFGTLPLTPSRTSVEGAQHIPSGFYSPAHSRLSNSPNNFRSRTRNRFYTPADVSMDGRTDRFSDRSDSSLPGHTLSSSQTQHGFSSDPTRAHLTYPSDGTLGSLRDLRTHSLTSTVFGDGRAVTEGRWLTEGRQEPPLRVRSSLEEESMVFSEHFPALDSMPSGGEPAQGSGSAAATQESVDHTETQATRTDTQDSLAMSTMNMDSPIRDDALLANLDSGATPMDNMPPLAIAIPPTSTATAITDLPTTVTTSLSTSPPTANPATNASSDVAQGRPPSRTRAPSADLSRPPPAQGNTSSLTRNRSQLLLPISAQGAPALQGSPPLGGRSTMLRTSSSLWERTTLGTTATSGQSTTPGTMVTPSGEEWCLSASDDATAQVVPLDGSPLIGSGPFPSGSLLKVESDYSLFQSGGSEHGTSSTRSVAESSPDGKNSEVLNGAGIETSTENHKWMNPSMRQISIGGYEGGNEEEDDNSSVDGEQSVIQDRDGESPEAIIRPANLPLVLANAKEVGSYDEGVNKDEKGNEDDWEGKKPHQRLMIQTPHDPGERHGIDFDTPVETEGLQKERSNYHTNALLSHHSSQKSIRPHHSQTHLMSASASALSMNSSQPFSSFTTTYTTTTENYIVGHSGENHGLEQNPERSGANRHHVIQDDTVMPPSKPNTWYRVRLPSLPAALAGLPHVTLLFHCVAAVQTLPTPPSTRPVNPNVDPFCDREEAEATAAADAERFVAVPFYGSKAITLRRIAPATVPAVVLGEINSHVFKEHTLAHRPKGSQNHSQPHPLAQVYPYSVASPLPFSSLTSSFPPPVPLPSALLEHLRFLANGHPTFIRITVKMWLDTGVLSLQYATVAEDPTRTRSTANPEDIPVLYLPPAVRPRKRRLSSLRNDISAAVKSGALEQLQEQSADYLPATTPTAPTSQDVHMEATTSSAAAGAGSGASAGLSSDPSALADSTSGLNPGASLSDPSSSPNAGPSRGRRVSLLTPSHHGGSDVVPSPPQVSVVTYNPPASNAFSVPTAIVRLCLEPLDWLSSSARFVAQILACVAQGKGPRCHVVTSTDIEHLPFSHPVILEGLVCPQNAPHLAQDLFLQAVRVLLHWGVLYSLTWDTVETKHAIDLYDITRFGSKDGTSLLPLAHTRSFYYSPNGLPSVTRQVVTMDNATNTTNALFDDRASAVETPFSPTMPYTPLSSYTPVPNRSPSMRHLQREVTPNPTPNPNSGAYYPNMQGQNNAYGHHAYDSTPMVSAHVGTSVSTSLAATPVPTVSGLHTVPGIAGTEKSPFPAHVYAFNTGYLALLLHESIPDSIRSQIHKFLAEGLFQRIQHYRQVHHQFPSYPGHSSQHPAHGTQPGVHPNADDGETHQPQQQHHRRSVSGVAGPGTYISQKASFRSMTSLPAVGTSAATIVTDQEPQQNGVAPLIDANGGLSGAISPRHSGSASNTLATTNTLAYHTLGDHPEIGSGTGSPALGTSPLGSGIAAAGSATANPTSMLGPTTSQAQPHHQHVMAMPTLTQSHVTQMDAVAERLLPEQLIDTAQRLMQYREYLLQVAEARAKLPQSPYFAFTNPLSPVLHRHAHSQPASNAPSHAPSNSHSPVDVDQTSWQGDINAAAGIRTLGEVTPTSPVDITAETVQANGSYLGYTAYPAEYYILEANAVYAAIITLYRHIALAYMQDKADALYDAAFMNSTGPDAPIGGNSSLAGMYSRASRNSGLGPGSVNNSSRSVSVRSHRTGSVGLADGGALWPGLASVRIQPDSRRHSRSTEPSSLFINTPGSPEGGPTSRMSSMRLATRLGLSKRPTSFDGASAETPPTRSRLSSISSSYKGLLSPSQPHLSPPPATPPPHAADSSSSPKSPSSPDAPATPITGLQTPGTRAISTSPVRPTILSSPGVDGGLGTLGTSILPRSPGQPTITTTTTAATNALTSALGSASAAAATANANAIGSNGTASGDDTTSSTQPAPRGRQRRRSAFLDAEPLPLSRGSLSNSLRALFPLTTASQSPLSGSPSSPSTGPSSLGDTAGPLPGLGFLPPGTLSVSSPDIAPVAGTVPSTPKGMGGRHEAVERSLSHIHRVESTTSMSSPMRSVTPVTPAPVSVPIVPLMEVPTRLSLKGQMHATWQGDNGPDIPMDMTPTFVSSTSGHGWDKSHLAGDAHIGRSSRGSTLSQRLRSFLSSRSKVFPDFGPSASSFSSAPHSRASFPPPISIEDAGSRRSGSYAPQPGSYPAAYTPGYNSSLNGSYTGSHSATQSAVPTASNAVTQFSEDGVGGRLPLSDTYVGIRALDPPSRSTSPALFTGVDGMAHRQSGLPPPLSPLSPLTSLHSRQSTSGQVSAPQTPEHPAASGTPPRTFFRTFTNRFLSRRKPTKASQMLGIRTAEPSPSPSGNSAGFGPSGSSALGRSLSPLKWLRAPKKRNTIVPWPDTPSTNPPSHHAYAHSKSRSRSHTPSKALFDVLCCRADRAHVSVPMSYTRTQTRKHRVLRAPTGLAASRATRHSMLTPGLHAADPFSPHGGTYHPSHHGPYLRLEGDISSGYESLPNLVSPLDSQSPHGNGREPGLQLYSLSPTNPPPFTVALPTLSPPVSLSPDSRSPKASTPRASSTALAGAAGIASRSPGPSSPIASRSGSIQGSSSGPGSGPSPKSGPSSGPGSDSGPSSGSFSPVMFAASPSRSKTSSRKADVSTTTIGSPSVGAASVLDSMLSLSRSVISGPIAQQHSSIDSAAERTPPSEVSLSTDLTDDVTRVDGDPGAVPPTRRPDSAQSESTDTQPLMLFSVPGNLDGEDYYAITNQTKAPTAPPTLQALQSLHSLQSLSPHVLQRGNRLQDSFLETAPYTPPKQDKMFLSLASYVSAVGSEGAFSSQKCSSGASNVSADPNKTLDLSTETSPGV